MNNQTISLEHFISSVQESVKDTPYKLERTVDGFEVSIDLADTKWWMPLSRSGLKDTFTYEVKCDETAKTYSINDTARRIGWQAGINAGDLKPYFDLSYKYQSGSIAGYHREFTIGGTDKGEIKPVVDISFSPSARKKAIKEIAKQLGWKRHFSTNQKIGLWFGGGGIFIAVVLLICALFIR